MKDMTADKRPSDTPKNQTRQMWFLINALSKVKLVGEGNFSHTVDQGLPRWQWTSPPIIHSDISGERDVWDQNQEQRDAADKQHLHPCSSAAMETPPVSRSISSRAVIPGEATCAWLHLHAERGRAPWSPLWSLSLITS